MNKVVVTKHRSLVDYILETGLADETAEIVEHTTADMVKGRDVIGILPLHLASLANTVTVVPLRIPSYLRGKELTLDEVRALAKHPRTFAVSEVTRTATCNRGEAVIYSGGAK